ncbi:hypothetical protein BG015_005749 [Linnemannia schmuckeri]|uniref:Uncharacterized protein n=1 Tax=Linnemannia schmuckeri TaxID=64567 RepID=A0A9P5VC76_9FUNG|nr:hypothetical protein BG015_005749 [Linnemannia schmuckeri]
MTRIVSSLLLLISAILAVTAQQGKSFTPTILFSTCGSHVIASSEAEIATLAACSTFSGSLTVLGLSAINAVALPALQALTGTIKIASNPHLTTLSLDSLQNSTGTIALFNNTLLSVINVPNIKTLNALEIVTAPSLRQLSLVNVQAISSFKVEDTGLDNSGTLPWSSFQKAMDIGISNNKFLKVIDIPGLNAISGRLVVAANGLMEGKGEGASLHLANLTTVSNCTLRHLTDLQLPSLTTVSSSLSFDETNLKLIQTPHLKSVGQTLSIVSNNNLNNISFSELTFIGGALLIANNTLLTSVNGFGKLKNIAGVLNMRGDFSNISFPDVSSVQGGMSILSSSKDFDCSTLSKVKASARGKTVCQAQVKSAKPTNSNGGDDDTLLNSANVLKLSTQGTVWAAVALLSGLASYAF